MKGYTLIVKEILQDKRNLQRNIAITVGCQIISLIVNMISKRAINIYLGLDYLGLQSVYSNFCDVLSFAFLGMGTAMLFSCYGPIVHKNYDKIVAIYKCYDSLYKKVSILVLGAGIISVILVVFIVNTEIETKEIVITYTSFMISVIIYNRYLVQNYFIQADEKRYIAAIITNGMDILALIVQIICLKYTKNYEIFIFCILIKNIIIHLIYNIYLKKAYCYLNKKVEAVSKKEYSEIKKNTTNMMIYRFGSVLITNTDSIFISKFINTIMVGVYCNYQFVLTGVNSLVGAFYGAITAKIGHLVQTTDKDKQYNNFVLCSFINIWISGFTTVCFYFLVEDFILIWMGEAKFLSSELLVVILINYYVVVCRYATRVYRESTGLFDKIQLVVLIKGILNIVLSYFFGRLWGLLGILIATTIASVMTLFWYEAKIVFDYFDKSFFCEVKYQICSIGLMVISFYITGLFCRNINGSGLGAFILKAFVCVIASNIVYCVLGFCWYLMYKKNIKKNGV